MTGRGGFALALAATLLALLPAGAAADTFTPTRFDDPGPLFICSDDDCSLREAIIAANNNGGADTIILAAGTYELELPGTVEDAAQDGDLDILDDVTITGQGMGATTIDAGGVATDERAFDIDPFVPASPEVQISGMTITGADLDDASGGGIRAQDDAQTTITGVSVTGNIAVSPSRDGGGIFNQNDAVMTIEDSIISGNRADDDGGGINNQNNGTLTIRRTTIADNATVNQNFAFGRGGGVFNQNDSQLTVEDSTVSGNTAGTIGGGFFIQNNPVVTLRNITVSGNTAADDGGGFFISNDQETTVSNSTITGNSADDDGGGIHLSEFFNGSFELSSSIVAGNADSGGGPDCSVHSDADEPVTSLGFNLLGDETGCDFASAAGDQIGTAGAPIDPQLGPLASNGGPTQTHVPAFSSPALESGVANGLATDQRGLPRTSDLALIPNAPGSDSTDIGAVEVQFPEGGCQGEIVPRIDGSDGNDTLTGTDAAETISGLGGNDSVNAGGGDDCVSGGAGKDRVKGAGGKDQVKGNAGKDTVAGGGGKDKLSGGGGKDKLKGGGGKDRIKTGGGKDKVNCGGGKDKVNAGRRDKVSQNCEKVR